MLAVERLATKAVLGEAPEELSFTFRDLDRAVNSWRPRSEGALMSVDLEDCARRGRSQRRRGAGWLTRTG
jgi:hypothetical protein